MSGRRRRLTGGSTVRRNARVFEEWCGGARWWARGFGTISLALAHIQCLSPLGSCNLGWPHLMSA